MFFGIFSVCFGLFKKVLFVSVVSIPVRNTETNRKFFFVSRNKPKNNRNRLSFGLFRFEPKKNFDRFEDTLGTGTGTGIGRDRDKNIYRDRERERDRDRDRDTDPKM